MTSRPHPRAASRLPRWFRLGLLAAAALVPAGAASAAVTQGVGCSDGGATVTCDLWAKTGTVAVPGGTVNVFGYSGTAAGAPELPGPVIVADVGDTVSVTVHNTLSAPTAMLFQEQPLRADLDPIPAGGSRTYTFTVDRAGTYLYEAAPFGGRQYQSALGMSGALVVRPAAAGQAYADAGSAYDAEHLVFVSELDKDLAANPAGFDMRGYRPEYHLINGKVAPDAAELPAAAGDRVLLRYLNGGVTAHSMGVLGAPQRVVGEDGNALANPREVVAETLGAGQTEDVVVALPAGADGRFPVYDTAMAMNNASATGMGGMLTFIGVAPAAAGADTAGPGTSGVALTGTTLAADVSDAATGGSAVTAAEYMLDGVTAPGTGTPMAGSFGTPSVHVTATPALTPGPHTVYVRGRDAQGNWGPVSSAFVATADSAGPATRGLSLAPNPSNGSAAVVLRGTADDTATGGSPVAGAEYAIDGGGAIAITPAQAATLTALEATIPAAVVATLTEGDHTVSVRSRDAAGNWGPPATIALTKDVTGPAGSGQTATPAYTNGTQGFSATIAAVRVKARFADAASAIAGGEGFIDTAGQPGKGFPMVPSDGNYDARTEDLQADIPLSTVKALAQGRHTVLLRGRDASGNWGGLVSTDLVVDTAGPTSTAVTATPNPTNAGASNATAFTLTATGTDALSPIARAEWFSGTDPGAGNGTAMTVSGGPASFTATAGIDFVALGWAEGARTVSVRMRDAAGNWGAPGNVTVTVVRPDLIFRDGFESGSASAWTSIANGGSRITFPAAANMAGTGTVGASVLLTGSTAGAAGSAYVTDDRPSAEATYHARFYLNPNGSDPGGTGGTGVVVLAGYSADAGGGTQRFAVRYRLSGGARQVRLDVARTGGTSSTAWANLAAGANPVEVFWQAGGATTAQLRVGTATPLTLAGLNTGAASRVESVRLGVQGLTGTRTGSLYLDAFASTRRTVVGP